MKIAKITYKGLINSFVSTTVVLLGIFLFCMVYIKDFFYNSVIHFVSSQISVVDALSDQLEYDSPEEHARGLAELLRNSVDIKRMELFLVDKRGDLLITSSGFKPTYKYKRDKYIKKTPEESISLGMLGAQKVLWFDHEIRDERDLGFRVEAVVLMDSISMGIKLIMAILITIMVSILIFVVISSTYFTNSIVNTIWTISRTTNKIAKGDFKTRVVKRTNDELGELCDAINNMAEELGTSERLKNEFVSSISHELRTPLTAIKGWAETISSEPTDIEVTQSGLKIIISEADRLSNMVEELLDFSRLQKAGSRLKKESVDIALLVGSVILIFAERARRDGKQLIFEGLPGKVVVFADPGRIKQVVINIIDNALKYSERGGRVWVLLSKQKDAEGQWVTITVKDTGCGIKQEDLGKVKTKFFKANYTKHGSGIGLAVADEIVGLHGGRLEIESVEAKGTTVKVVLPVVEEG